MPSDRSIASGWWPTVLRPMTVAGMTMMGLAIAHAAVVKRHRGAIAFESEIGGGTMFIVCLPVGGVRLTRSEIVEAVNTQRKLPAHTAEGT